MKKLFSLFIALLLVFSLLLLVGCGKDKGNNTESSSSSTSDEDSGELDLPETSEDTSYDNEFDVD